MKYYFIHRGDEFCYSKSIIKKYLVENNLKEINVFEAKKSENLDFLYCKKFQEIGDKKYCGKNCNEYIPRNGKNGCCKYFGYCYEPTDKIIKIKK
jgi:hypothetical protein